VICFKGGDTRVCLRNLADPVMTPVPGSEGADYVRFSPSGQSIAWSTSDGIRRASVSGGAVERVVNTSRLNGLTWIDESHIAFVSGTELWSVRTNGADKRQVVRLPPEFLVLLGPSAVPGGTHILVALSKDIGNPDSSHVAVVSLRDGKLTDLGVRGVGPRYVAPGLLAVVRADAAIHIMPFSLRSRSVTGPDTTAFTTVTGSSSGYAFSENGTAIYLSGDSRADQVIIAVDSNGVEHPFAPVGRAYREPRISPDGKHVVVRIGPGATNGDLWVQDVVSGSLSRLTRDGMSIRGEWTRDGKRIVFVDRPTADTEIVYSQPWDGSAGPTELVRSRKPYEYYQLGLGPPGGWTIVRSGQSASNELLIAPTDSLAQTKLFVHGSPSTMSPRISPNGHLVAYSSNETGRLEVYIRPLPGPGAMLPVSIEGGTEPMWSRDGTQLYYRGPTRMMVASIVERPEPAVVRRDSLFVDRYRRYSQHSSYDVFANGQLLMTRNRSERTGIFVVTNWDTGRAKTGER